MAGRQGNKTWLRQQLAAALGWDAATTEGVVDAIAAANGSEEVKQLVDNFIGADVRAQQAVRQFLGAAAGGSHQQQTRPAGGGGSSSGTQAQRPPPAEEAPKVPLGGM